MSMITEIYGMSALQMTKAEIIKRIQTLPPSQDERRTYLLHDWAAATGQEVTEDDFKAVSSQA